MTKLEALREKYETAKREEAAYHERIAAKEQELADLMKAEAAAAVAGDTESYASTKGKRKDLEDEIYVLKSSDPAALIKPEAIQAAWSEVAAQYRKDALSFEKDLDKQTKALLALYQKMVAVQVKMLQARDEIAKIARIEPLPLDLEDQYRGKLPVEFVGLKGKQSTRIYRSRSILAEYLAEAGELKDDDIAWSNLIFQSHKLF